MQSENDDHFPFTRLPSRYKSRIS